MEESKIESSDIQKEINLADNASLMLTKNNVFDFSLGLIAALVINTIVTEIFVVFFINYIYPDFFFNDYGLFYFSVAQFTLYAIEFYILHRLKYDYIANGVLSIGIFLLSCVLFVLWIFKDWSF
jgi:hypothetical protein